MKVLLAIDQYHSDSKPIKLAKEIMVQVPGTKLIVLYVSKGSSAVYYRTPIGVQEAITDKTWQCGLKLENEILHEFHPWVEQIRFEHLVGDPTKVICEVADEEQVDLVILGQSHSHKEHPRLGTVVHGVINHINQPVLVAI